MCAVLVEKLVCGNDTKQRDMMRARMHGSIIPWWLYDDRYHDIARVLSHADIFSNVVDAYLSDFQSMTFSDTSFPVADLTPLIS